MLALPPSQPKKTAVKMANKSQKEIYITSSHNTSTAYYILCLFPLAEDHQSSANDGADDHQHHAEILFKRLVFACHNWPIRWPIHRIDIKTWGRSHVEIYPRFCKLANRSSPSFQDRPIRPTCPCICYLAYSFPRFLQRRGKLKELSGLRQAGGPNKTPSRKLYSAPCLYATFPIERTLL